MKLINWIKELCIRFKELILYGICGVGTTAINYGVYFLGTDVLHIDPTVANVIAWLLSFIFAYLTNRTLVFHSEAKEKKYVIKEVLFFTGSRVATGALETLIIFIFVTNMEYDYIIVKVCANVIVILLNYLFSKFVTFSKKRKVQ